MAPSLLLICLALLRTCNPVREDDEEAVAVAVAALSSPPVLVTTETLVDERVNGRKVDAASLSGLAANRLTLLLLLLLTLPLLREGVSAPVPVPGAAAAGSGPGVGSAWTMIDGLLMVDQRADRFDSCVQVDVCESVV